MSYAIKAFACGKLGLLEGAIEAYNAFAKYGLPDKTEVATKRARHLSERLNGE